MSLKPGTQDKKLGRSSPINEEIPAHSCIAVYERKSGGQKFVHLDTSKFRGQFLILLVLDNNLTDDEARNILEFNENLENFRGLKCRMVGVATVSNISLRSWMQNQLQGLKFAVVADKSGDLCRALGVIGSKSTLSPRCLVIISPNGTLIHVSKYNSNTYPQANNILKLIKTLKEKFASEGMPYNYENSDYTASEESTITAEASTTQSAAEQDDHQKSDESLSAAKSLTSSTNEGKSEAKSQTSKTNAVTSEGSSQTSKTASAPSRAESKTSKADEVSSGTRSQTSETAVASSRGKSETSGTVDASSGTKSQTSTTSGEKSESSKASEASAAASKQSSETRSKNGSITSTASSGTTLQ
jgi:alkyl hydroperoxide reductase subunit AhpC